MTNKEKLLGNLFREALYTNSTTPEMLEFFSKKISSSFSSEDFLLLQMASQLFESAQIRKKAYEYMSMTAKMSSKCFEVIEQKHPELYFCTSQRFKSVQSEIYKRYERVQDGLSPEIKDLLAVRVILLMPETQEALQTEYIIAKEIMENFSLLNSDENFPLYVNLSMPDKSVSQSDFDPEKHPEVLIPDDSILIPGLEKLGKDYMHHPKGDGYQSFHISLELVKKSEPTFRFFSEVQIRTIAQHQYSEYGPASHKKYKDNRNKKMQEIFTYEKDKVHLFGYHPDENPEHEIDFSGFSKPTFITERSKTF